MPSILIAHSLIKTFKFERICAINIKGAFYENMERF